MATLSDLKRAWLLKALGLGTSLLSEADLETLLYSGQAVFNLEGTGSPQGVVDAPIGSVYTDKQGYPANLGAYKWIRTSLGVGNTGWEVLYGDTEYRAMSGTHTNGWSNIGGSFLRRIGKQVICFASGNQGVASGLSVYTLPIGYRPLIGANYTVQSGLINIDISGLITPGSPTTAVRATCTFITNDPWPVALPGIAYP